MDIPGTPTASMRKETADVITNRDLDLISDTVLEALAAGTAPESPSPAPGFDAADAPEHAAEPAR